MRIGLQRGHNIGALVADLPVTVGIDHRERSPVRRDGQPISIRVVLVGHRLQAVAGSALLGPEVRRRIHTARPLCTYQIVARSGVVLSMRLRLRRIKGKGNREKSKGIAFVGAIPCCYALCHFSCIGGPDDRNRYTFRFSYMLILLPLRILYYECSGRLDLLGRHRLR